MTTRVLNSFLSYFQKISIKFFHLLSTPSQCICHISLTIQLIFWWIGNVYTQTYRPFILYDWRLLFDVISSSNYVDDGRSRQWSYRNASHTCTELPAAFPFCCCAFRFCLGTPSIASASFLSFWRSDKLIASSRSRSPQQCRDSLSAPSLVKD